MVPGLQRAAGASNTIVINAITGDEDFAFYQKKVPGLFFFGGQCLRIRIQTQYLLTTHPIYGG